MNWLKTLILFVVQALSGLFQWKANTSDPKLAAETEYQKALIKWREGLKGYADAKNKAEKEWWDASTAEHIDNDDHVNKLYAVYLESGKTLECYRDRQPERKDFGAE